MAIKRSSSVLSNSDSSSKSNSESGPDSEDEQITVRRILVILPLVTNIAQKIKQQLKALQAELAKTTQNDESKHSKHGKRKVKRLKKEAGIIVVPPSVMDGVIDLCSD